MTDVFISYKSERRLAAEHLKRVLEVHGFSVWYDYRGLIGGPDFGPQIEKELRGARAAIVLWCERASQSKWVREEAHLADSLGIYVPTIIAPKAEPPLGLRLNQHIDLTTWSGSPRAHELDALLIQIERMVGRESVIKRAAMQKLDEDWRLYGAPSVLGLPLETELDENTISRSWAAPQQAESVKELVDPPPSKPATERASKRFRARDIAAADQGLKLANEAWRIDNGIGEDEDGERARELYSEAFPLLQQGAAAGIPDAQYELAKCYWHGRGVEMDEVEGIRWLLLRTKQEDSAFSLEILGDWYRRGGSQVAANKIRARDAYTRSGRESAMLEMAEMDEQGEDGPVDFASAVEIYKRLAGSNDGDIAREAQRRLIRLGEDW